ncbi:hypothetical protein ACFLRW_04035 [Acidobacteriota bacterium]
MNIKILFSKTWIVRATVFLTFSAVVLSGIAISKAARLPQDVQQWTVQTHDRTNFPLIGKHRTVECRECHLNLVFEGTPSSCEACHWERRQDDRYQLRLGSHCADCHTPHSWKNVQPNKWNHRAETGYRLQGIHRTLDCVDCHGDQDFQSISLGCFDCHEEDYRQTQEPDHSSAGFPTQCQICHYNNNRWEDADFSHDFFILKGQHLSANCSSCHLEGKFSGIPTDCYLCHSTDFSATEDPDHEKLGFPTDCVICHSSSAQTWDGARLNHDSFVLSGQHLLADCVDCHADGIFSGRSSECVSCHLPDFQNTTEPDHESAGFPTDCLACHRSSAESWEGAQLNHDSFVLSGQHLLADCVDCHADGIFSGRSSECVSCHLPDFQNTTEPDHESAGFPTDCLACHRSSAESWEGAQLNHDSFVLSGQHLLADCVDCHADGIFAGRSSECVSCHLPDFQNTTEPDHESAGFPTDCLACHRSSAESWEGAQLNHDSFVLSGQHLLADCVDCHSDGIFAGRSSECVSCHLPDFQNTTEPDHELLGFPPECQVCHGTNSETWDGASFDHNIIWPLTGAHTSLDCSLCHSLGTTPSRECYGCHAADYEATSNPDHGEAGFPTDCVVCHDASTGTWMGAIFVHDSFVLSGQHLFAECIDCHAGGIFAGRSSECVSCHLLDFQNTTDPDHELLGFPQECQVCHGTNSETWDGASFDHNSFWPLTGAHTSLDCSLCHSSGTTPPRECYGCHAADYEATSNPDHGEAGFPTDCVVCHDASTGTWMGAVFVHDSFVLSGQHLLAECIDCHAGGIYSGRPSECVSCHLLEFQNTTDPDHELMGFPFDCQACHGTSSETWDGASFDHNSIWSLLGPHTTLDCSMCHSSGTTPPRECYGCHAADYEATSDPDHGDAGFPTDCVACHFPTHMTWNQAQFNHDFPIDAAKHGTLVCADCHLAANFLEFSCTHCHSHNKTRMDGRHKGLLGYFWLSMACYTCHIGGQN